MRYLNWPVSLDQIEIGKPVGFGSGKIAWVVDRKTVPDSDTITISAKRVKVRDRSNEESPWLDGSTYVFDLESLFASHEFSYIK